MRSQAELGNEIANKAVLIYGAFRGVAGMQAGGGASGGALVLAAGLTLDAVFGTAIVASFTASGIISIHGEIADILDGHACAEATGAESAGGGKGGGKNAQHANQAKRDAAAEKYKELKESFEKMRSKPNKTPADKELLDKLEKALKHQKQKMDFTGENHSQRPKR